MDKIDAISIASKNCFDYYNMGRDFGGIAPGKMADILVFDDLEKVKPNRVFVGGKLVVSHGEIVTSFVKPKIPTWITKTVNIRRKFTEKDFVIKSKEKSPRSMVIKLDTEIITKKDYEDLQTDSGNVLASFDKDIWKVTAIDRTFGTGKSSLGFLKNFGPDIGAFGSTQSFHENNMVIIGNNEKDMAFVANELTKIQGGIIAVKNQKILANLPLPVAGLISNLSFEDTILEFSNLNSKIVDAGCKFKNPVLIPLFLPFLALPDVRIISGGIVDIKKRQYVDIFKNHDEMMQQ